MTAAAPTCLPLQREDTSALPLTTAESPVEDAEFGVPRPPARRRGNCLMHSREFTRTPSVDSMDPAALKSLLDGVRAGQVTPEDAAARLATLPYEDLGFAKVDHHRALRRGFPEAVFGAGKTPDQIKAIVDRIAARGQRVLVTRLSADVAQQVGRSLPGAQYHEAARCLTVDSGPRTVLSGCVAVLAAGTSDLAVAEEAAVVAEFYGARVDRVYDVGVAGLHRLLDRTETIRHADVVIVVAGMEGALPSVVAGLVDTPLVAVPTSIGYGAAFHGLAALLAMLNACASGVGVVNI